MATTKNEADLQKLRGELTALRDEIKVRLHLGAMDARDAFHTVEHELEHLASDTSRATKEALIRARTRLRELADNLRDVESHKSS